VIENKQWHNIVRALKLPATCTNAAYALRVHYFKYLRAFEQKQLFGIEPTSALTPDANQPNAPAVGNSNNAPADKKVASRKKKDGKKRKRQNETGTQPHNNSGAAVNGANGSSMVEEDSEADNDDDVAPYHFVNNGSSNDKPPSISEETMLLYSNELYLLPAVNTVVPASEQYNNLILQGVNSYEEISLSDDGSKAKRPRYHDIQKSSSVQHKYNYTPYCYRYSFYAENASKVPQYSSEQSDDQLPYAHFVNGALIKRQQTKQQIQSKVCTIRIMCFNSNILKLTRICSL